MYEAFYGMKVRPFALTPDPAFLFMSRKHRFAFSMLEYALTGQAGFTVITGEIGSGKTTLIRHLLRGRDRGVNFGVISNTHESFGCLLQWILTAFGISSATEDRAARYQAFVRYLIAQFGEGHQTVLIVDEAQNLSIELLEELRLLSNINADNDQLLQMILVGQPELLHKLRRPELTQFAQRISVNYHLPALSYSETRAYIRHRLRVAGANPDLMADSAVRAVFHFTNGVPRIINSICDMACVYGYAEGLEEIGAETVIAVIQDKEKDALLPLYNSSGRLDHSGLLAAIEESVSASCAREGVYEEPPVRAPEPTPSVPEAAREMVQDDGPEIGADIAAEVAPAATREIARAAPAKPAAAAVNVDRGHVDRAHAPRTLIVEPARLSPTNAIVPIMSQRNRRRGNNRKMGWFLRLL